MEDAMAAGTHPTSEAERDLTLVLPAYNEERDLERGCLLALDALRALADERPGMRWLLVVASNGSTDATPRIAERLERRYPGEVRSLVIERAGRGGALKRAWEAFPAHVLAYTDVDLSCDIAQLGALVDPVLGGRADIAFGSRLAPGARTQRRAGREAISRIYNALLQRYLHVGFRDAQCGFKAVDARVAREVVPAVADDGWFFDTELLVRAERSGLRLHELPARWREDPRSSVRILRTALADLAGMRRLRSEL